MTKPKPKRPDADANRYYDAEQAAKVCGVHPEVFRRNVRNGTYGLQAFEKPTYRSKRKYFFKIIDVELLAARLEAAREASGKKKTRKSK